MKSTSKWAKYWNDIISYTKNRAYQSLQTKCSKVPTEFDKKMLILIGQADLLKRWQSEAKRNTFKIEEEHLSDESDFDENIENYNYQLEIENQQKTYLVDECQRTESDSTNLKSKRNMTNDVVKNDRKRSLDTTNESSNSKADDINNEEVLNEPPPKKKNVTDDNLENNEDKSNRSEYKKEFAEALAEFPKAFNSIAQGFLILSSAIEKIGKVFEKYNK